MRSDQFQLQMNRLVEQFAKAAYGTERCKIIWQEVQDFEAGWFSKVIDKFIGECRQAPLLPEFREEISKERERLWRIEKLKHEEEAKDFFEGSYQPDDVKAICQTIVKRLKRDMSDSDYANFQKILNNVTSSNPTATQKTQCKRCDDSGLVFHRDQNNCEWVFCCTCNAGIQKPKSYPIYQQ